MRVLAQRWIARFSMVGLAATAIHISIAFAARELFGLLPVAANAAGFSCAFLISYFGHHQWTFGRSGNHGAHLRRFLTLSLLSFALSHLITVAVTGWLGLDYRIALAAILAVVPATTFLGSRFWAFAEIGHDATEETSAWPYAGAAVSLLIGVVVFLWQQGTPFNHDTSWYFIATRMWMDGTPLYDTIMEINPPMPFYVTRVILGAGDLLGLGDAEAFRLVLFGLIAVSLALTDLALNGAPVTPARRAALLVAAAAGLLIAPLREFGQREHLMIILAMPYLAGAAMRNAGRAPMPAQAALFAVFATPGLLLKPYFLTLPLFVTLLQVWKEKSLRPLLATENLIIGAAALIYLTAILVFHPAYLETVVPLARLVYFAFDGPALAVLSRPGFLFALAATVPLLLKGPDRAENGLAIGLSAAVAAFALTYAVQFKGFHYHIVPALAAALLLGTWHVLAARDLRSRAVAGVVLALVASASIIDPLAHGPYRPAIALRLKAALGEDVAGKGAMVFTTNVSRAFPLINMTGMKWTSRYPTQWVVPGAYIGLMETPVDDEEKRRAFKDALAYSLRTAAEDFVAHKPEIVIVDTREEKGYFSGHAFDWIAFMREDAAFAAEWQNYRLEKAIRDFHIWWRVR